MMQEFVQEIQNTVQRGLRGIHTAMPGRIVSFDAAKGIATVKPAMKFKKPDGKTMDFPQVTGVPVVFPQGAGQGATIAFPVKPGDSCLLGWPSRASTTGSTGRKPARIWPST